jgi:hypothetical protein
VTGADEDGVFDDESNNPAMTSSQTDSDQTESEPYPDGYTEVDKLEF